MTSRVASGEDFERAHDPLLVWDDNQQSEDRGPAQPVQDDEYPQHDVRDRQRSG